MLLRELGLTDNEVAKDLTKRISTWKGVKDIDPQTAHRIYYGTTGSLDLGVLDRNSTLASKIVDEAISQLFVGTNLDGEQKPMSVGENTRSLNYLYATKGDIIERVLTRCLRERIAQLDNTKQQLVTMLLNNKQQSWSLQDIRGALGVNGYTRYFREQLGHDITVLKKIRGHDQFIVQSSSQKQGVMNLAGEVIIPCEYRLIRDRFKNNELADIEGYGFHPCAYSALGRQGLAIIDFEGKTVIPQAPHSTSAHYVGGGYFKLDDMSQSDIHNRQYLAKIGGEKITSSDYSFFWHSRVKNGMHSGNYFMFHKHEDDESYKKGALNDQGKEFVPALFDLVDFHNSFVRTENDNEDDNKYGAYSYEGDEILPTVYHSIEQQGAYLKTRVRKMIKKYESMDKLFPEDHYSLFDMQGNNLTTDKTYREIYTPDRYPEHLILRSHDGTISIAKKDSPDTLLHSYSEPEIRVFAVSEWHKKFHKKLDEEMQKVIYQH